MAVATGGERAIKVEGGVWFWAEEGSVLMSVSDPEIHGHSVITELREGAATTEILKLLVKMGRKVD